MIARLIARRRLEQSYAVCTGLLVILLLGAITLVVDARMEDVLKRGLAARATSVAQSIGAVATPSLLAYNYPALQIAADGASGDRDISYVVIYDKEGRVAGSAGVHLDAIEIEPMAVASDLAVRTRQVHHKHGKQDVPILEVEVPVRVEGSAAPWGRVRVAMAYDTVIAEKRRTEVALAIVGVLLALHAVAFARVASRRVTAPLARLVQATEALARGDLTRRIPVTGARDLAELAVGFNSMMDRLQEKAAESRAYQIELAQLNATLEQQVRERTRELEESERQYRTLVEYSPESILIVQEGRLRFVNPSFEQTFGVSAEQALAEGFSLDSLFEGESAPRVRERIGAWTRGETPGSIEVLGRDRHCRERMLELRGSPIDYKGRPAAECLLVDVTDAHRLREELEDTNRLRALGELASGVAHDFNNLLSAILGRAQLMQRQPLVPGLQRDLAVIERAALDGRETVLRIQEFSRTRTDRPFGGVDLPAVLADTVEITRSRWKSDAQRSGVTIQVEIDTVPVPPVLGSATELREVFTNLILNAVDAMPLGGRLVVSCRHEGDIVRARVEDNGVGMTEATRRRLFDPFFSTKGVSGNGMGMSVAYGIVKRHGGNIEVTSEQGQGTCFTLEFPVHEGDVTSAAASRPAIATAPARILVIDDERPIAELLCETLEIEGHHVVTAGGGVRGVELAAAGDYDLVLTDLGMPDMSGWDVTREIRRRHPRLPVILVTGWGTTLGPEEIARHGVAAVVHKPFELAPLLATVARVLEDARDRGGASAA